MGIPWRVAFALQADGWWLRSDIIWAKPNPMPESVTDRPTKAHEYIFLLTKSARYYWDAQAVAEPSIVSPRWHEPDAKYLNERHGDGETSRGNGFHRVGKIGGTRNLRSVWSIATHPYSGAHFATFPPALAERCIKAGTSERGCCPRCGKPWERVVEKGGGTTGKSWHDHGSDLERGMSQPGCSGLGDKDNGNGMYRVTSLGFRPTCACDAGEPVPCLVLDPFGGAGTVGLVAQRLFRRWVSLDLKGEYCQMARERIGKEAGMFEQAAS